MMIKSPLNGFLKSRGFQKGLKKCLQGDSKNWSPLKFVEKVCWVRQKCRKMDFSTGGGRGYNAFFLDFLAYMS